MPFTSQHDASLISWIRTPVELHLFTGPMLEFPLDAAQLDGLRSMPELTQFAAEHEGTVVGHIELVAVAPGEARIARVIVDPARQGAGLGELLLRAVVSEARERGIRKLSLKVIPTNARAIALYEKLGFEHAGEELGALVMRRDLP